MSSSSDYPGLAEDSIFSSVLMPDGCGLRWEKQLQMSWQFQTANSNLKVCKTRLKGLYDARDELTDKQTLIQLQINRAEASQRKAEGSFKTCHYPILPDATNKDIECMLKLDGSSLQAAALFGPLTGPTALSSTCSPNSRLTSMLLLTTSLPLLVRLLPRLA